MRRLVTGSWRGVVLLVLLAAGCSTPVSPHPFDPPLTQSFQGTTAAPGNFTTHNVTAPERGVATATLTWTAGDLDFFVTDATCVDGPFICPNRAFADSINTTLEIIKFGMVEGETLKLWVLNFAAPIQNYNIDFILE